MASTLAQPVAPAAAAPVASLTGSVVAFGDNASGQLGTGNAADSFSPVAVAGLGGVTAVSAGGLHSLALKGDGTVVAFGANYAGQLGDGTTRDRAKPVPVPDLEDVVAISAGGAHSLALTRSGTVLAWGANNFGQLGDGTTRFSSTPVAVVGLTDVVAIAAGSAHNLAVTRAGAVYSWGDNAFGQLGDNTFTNQPNATPRRVVLADNTPVTGASAVSAGMGNSFIVKAADGSVLGWGRSDFGQGGVGSLFPGNVVSPTPVLMQVGPLPATRAKNCNTPNDPTSVCVPLTGVKTITTSKASPAQTLAIRSNGSLVVWGANFEGQLGIGSIKPNANGLGRAVPVPGLDGSTPAKTVVAVSAGGQSLALTATGSVLSWGLGYLGALGTGGPRFSAAPVVVPGLSGVSAIGAGGAHSLAVTGVAVAAAPTGPPLVNVTRAQVPEGAAAASDTPPPANAGATPTTAGVAATFAPVIAADPTRPGHLAMAYTDDQGSGTAPDRCRLSLSTDGGSTWTNRVLVGAGGDFPTVPSSAAEPAIAFESCGVPLGGAGVAPYALAFGPQGTLYFAFTATGDCGVGHGGTSNCGRDGRVFLTASADGGGHFSPPVAVDTAARLPARDYLESLAVDQASGEVYLAWAEFSVAHLPYVPIFVARCTPAPALTCGPATPATPARTLDALLHLQLTVGRDHRLYLAWLDETELFASDGNTPGFGQGGNVGPITANVAVSADHGRSFGAPTVADRVFQVCPVFSCPAAQEASKSTADNQPFGVAAFYDVSIATRGAVAGQTGDGTSEGPDPVYVAVSGFRFETGEKSRIAVSTSTDGGLTFGRGRIVGLVAGREANHQHNPGLAVSAAGRLSMAYYDRAPNFSQDVFSTSLSGEGGFTSPLKLNSVSSDEALLGGTQASSGSNDLSRVAVTATDTGTAVAWLDSRLGTTQPGQPNTGRTDTFVASVPSPVEGG